MPGDGRAAGASATVGDDRTPCAHEENSTRSALAKKKARLLQQLDDLRREEEESAIADVRKAEESLARAEEAVADLTSQLETAQKRLKDCQEDLARKRAEAVSSCNSDEQLPAPSITEHPFIQGHRSGSHPTTAPPPSDTYRGSSNSSIVETDGMVFYKQLDTLGKGKAPAFNDMSLDRLRDLVAAKESEDGGATSEASIIHAYYSIFLKTGETRDLESAISHATRQLGVTNQTTSSPDYYESNLKNLVVLLVKKHRHSRSLQDLQEAIFRAYEMVTHTHLRHPDRRARTTDLISLLLKKANHTGSQDDMDEAMMAAHTTGVEITIDTSLSAPSLPSGSSLTQVGVQHQAAAHALLCNICVGVLSLVRPMEDFAPFVLTSYRDILSRESRCFICAVFVKTARGNLKSSLSSPSTLGAVHENWVSSIRENRGPKDLWVMYSIVPAVTYRNDKISGETVLDNKLHLSWRFDGDSKFDRGLEFLLSPLEPDQPEDKSLKLFFIPHELRQSEDRSMSSTRCYSGNLTGAPSRVEQSDNCPFCLSLEGSFGTGAPTDLAGCDDDFVGDGTVQVDGSINPAFFSDNTGSSASLALAREWLRVCATSHSQCHAPSRTGTNGVERFYPTRLLDLSTLVTEGSERTDLRLIVTAETPPEGDYMTLSHCWGQLEFTTLTTENLSSFQHMIPFSDLTRTFQEAVIFTRRLGVQYLWIDSLCIIQKGSLAECDWQHESARMDKVYLHSFLNIGATGAADGSRGFFRERDYTRQVCRPILLKPDCKRHQKQYYQPYRLVEEKFVEENLLKQPLLQRGWVFQERFLAPRMLHFGSEQMFWECREVLASEACPEHVRPDSNLIRLPNLVKAITSLQSPDTAFSPEMRAASSQVLSPLDSGPSTSNGVVNLPPPSSEPFDLAWSVAVSLWENIVQEYMTKALTQGRDKLVALSGVARQYADYLCPDSRYLAGIWSHMLLPGLLWRPVTTESVIRRIDADEWRAPTWSWASVDGEIRFYQGDGKALVAVQEIEVEVVNPANPFGAVRSAVLSLQGKITPLGLMQQGNVYRLIHNGRVVAGSEWIPDQVLPTTISTMISNGATVLCLALVVNENWRMVEVCGLILDPKEKSESGVCGGYTRTGTFSVLVLKDDQVDCLDAPFDELKGLDPSREDLIKIY
ncbi:heterokaryon incompatibility protein-domain-containing protein [Lasiosphaeria hispida]|uniref:Heterokaryon incompatibility protein-domain-containing protein n=1 Tax=Lasiosphaeria hispida TaxID=260671 RepID=A0AAJ0HCY0_9PEZI|nr:heterokaryon incompatibility protein-domain-containing protein [Lasiosphaeria hispida]